MIFFKLALANSVLHQGPIHVPNVSDYQLPTEKRCSFVKKQFAECLLFSAEEASAVGNYFLVPGMSGSKHKQTENGIRNKTRTKGTKITNAKCRSVNNGYDTRGGGNYYMAEAVLN